MGAHKTRVVSVDNAMPAGCIMSNLFCVLFLKNAAVNVLSQTSDGSEWQSPRIFTGSFEQNN